MSTYYDSMNALQFTQEQKERMTRTLVEKAQAAQTQTSSISSAPARKRRRPLAAAAAIVVALILGTGTVAFATGSLLNIESFIGSIFNGAPSNTEVVERIGRPVGASATDNGITITADAILGDRASYTVIYTVEKEDGSTFDVETNTPPYLPYAMEGGPSTPGTALGLLSRGITGAIGESYFIDTNPEDNAIQYVERIGLVSNSGIVNVSGATLDTEFTELRHYDANDDIDFEVHGSWPLRFTIEYEDLSVQIPVHGEKFSLVNGEASLTELYISPVSLYFWYIVDEPAVFEQEESGQMSAEMEQEMNRLLDVGTITFTMKDGSTIVQEDHAGGSIEADGKSCNKIQVLDTLLDVDELASITIGGTTINVSA